VSARWSASLESHGVVDALVVGVVDALVVGVVDALVVGVVDGGRSRRW
jgi:microcompartment protein CcmK/EutM